MVSRLSFGPATDDGRERDAQPFFLLSGSGVRAGASGFIYLTNDSISEAPVFDFTSRVTERA